MWKAGEGEQAGGTAADVQHRCHPLEGAGAETEDGGPPAAGGPVDVAASRNSGVEAAGEGDGGGVADGELHRGHGVDPAANQGGGGAGEQVVFPSLPSGT